MGFFTKLMRFVTLRVAEGIVIILLIAFMPNLPPYCKISNSRTITPSMPLEGKLALNNKLDNVEIWHKGQLNGPEGFADYDGELYTSLQSGEIVKLIGEHIIPIVQFGKPCKGPYQEKICGRPLGIAFDKDGFLIAVDAYYGIFKVNVKTGDTTQLISVDQEIAGKKPKLPNSIALATNGDIFWSDSSTEFLLQDGAIDSFADGSGRLIHYNAKTKENTVLIDNLLFANGVALSEDEDFVLVVETGASAIHRYYLKGPKKGSSDLFIDGLPGLPDNLKSDGKGGFFAPLVASRDSENPIPTQFLAPWPLIRKFISRIFGLTEFGFNLIQKIYPNEYAEKAIHFVGHFSSLSLLLPKRVTILHLSKNAEIIQSWHTTNKKISAICEMHIFKGQVYLGTPFNDYIGRISADKLGLEGYGLKKEPVKVTPQPPKTETITSTTPKPTTTTEKPTTTTPKPSIPQNIKEENVQKSNKNTEKPTDNNQKPIKTGKVKENIQKPTETMKKPKPTTTEKPTVTPQKPTKQKNDVPIKEVKKDIKEEVKKTVKEDIKSTENKKDVPKTQETPNDRKQENVEKTKTKNEKETVQKMGDGVKDKVKVSETKTKDTKKRIEL
ncbi:adipocyte plasma membrane-associated protein Hemomucin-like [Onthophagus taurus]|uniref:adipocyte plasma membrane-associated protein Hemomucin-like n=1 Tax=Onthophagus taurus TaxID=166361 RepID=UPI0039BDAAC7